MFCENCKINFDTDTGSCPLCFEKIGDPKYEDRLFPPRPKTITRKAMGEFNKAYFFATVVISGVLGVINYFATKRLTWSLLVLSCLVYLYALVRNTILAKSEIAAKTLIQAVLMSLFLYAIDYFATDNIMWSLKYAVPFLLVASTLLLTILALSNKRKWRDFTLSVLFMALVGFVPFVLYLTGVINVFWPSLIAFLYSAATVMGMLIFHHQKLTNEIKKSLHI